MATTVAAEQFKDKLREDAGRTLARYAITQRFEALPTTIVKLTKQCILDTLGTTLAGTTLAPEAPMFHQYVRDIDGRKECTLIGYGEKGPAQMAAFLNGANSHMLDYDDVGSGHVSIATIPVAFAVAEKVGNISGREFLTAVAVGVEIHTRIFPYALSEGWVGKQKFSQTQSIGYFSGAAVAGRLLGLSEEQMINAMGLAYQQVAGVQQRHLGMHAGWCGQSAVLAALLAKQGVPGVKDLLDGKNGFFQVYLRNVEPDYDRLVGELGTRFRTLDLHEFKAWPACALTRKPVNSVLDLRKEHKLNPDDIESIVISGGEHLLLLAEPLEDKRRPTHSTHAKYSIPFTVGVAMTYGDVKLHHYTEGGLKDRKVLAMADRISVKKDESLARDKKAASAEIRTRDGKIYQKLIKHPLGDDRNNPMSQEQLEEKFRDCASFAQKQIAKENVDRLIKMVTDLENLPDIRQITDLL